MSIFYIDEHLPTSRYGALCTQRAMKPDRILVEAQTRRRRPALTTAGTLVIVAADHRSHLARIWAVFEVDGVDGVMGTADVIEDLLLLLSLERDEKGWSRLDGRLLVGCMNRGGLRGASVELDDRYTAYTIEGIERFRLDAAACMVRIDPRDSTTAPTLQATARAVDAVTSRGVTMFLEAMAVRRNDAVLEIVPEALEQARASEIAAGLGTSSAYTWLKLPIVPPFETVAAATSLPILVLGGDPPGAFEDFLPVLEYAIAAGPNVRGALIGRNFLFPVGTDPVAAAEAVVGLVHQSWTVAEATMRGESSGGML
ncbi:MAG: hypothetical protein FJX78_09640 [Armatimonadetes bacterium]|nr:hypothetical protein [Armatimonadota bacterium]